MTSKAAAQATAAATAAAATFAGFDADAALDAGFAFTSSSSAASGCSRNNLRVVALPSTAGPALLLSSPLPPSPPSSGSRSRWRLRVAGSTALELGAVAEAVAVSSRLTHATLHKAAPFQVGGRSASEEGTETRTTETFLPATGFASKITRGSLLQGPTFALTRGAVVELEIDEGEGTLSLTVEHKNKGRGLKRKKDGENDENGDGNGCIVETTPMEPFWSSGSSSNSPMLLKVRPYHGPRKVKCVIDLPALPEEWKKKVSKGGDDRNDDAVGGQLAPRAHSVDRCRVRDP